MRVPIAAVRNHQHRVAPSSNYARESGAPQPPEGTRRYQRPGARRGRRPWRARDPLPRGLWRPGNAGGGRAGCSRLSQDHRARWRRRGLVDTIMAGVRRRW